MKRFLLIMIASFCLISASAQEQDNIKSYSVYDVNHDAQVTIQDIASLVNRVKENIATDKQVVDADTINFLLNSMSDRLKDLDNMMLLIDRLDDKVELAQAKGDAAKATAELSLTKAEMYQMAANTKVDQTEFDAAIKSIYAMMAAIDEKSSYIRFVEKSLGDEINARKALEKEVAELKAIIMNK